LRTGTKSFRTKSQPPKRADFQRFNTALGERPGRLGRVSNLEPARACFHQDF
jgi:hypothetical protein